MLKERVLTDRLITLGRMSKSELFNELNTNINGLSNNMVEARRDKFGKNEVTHEKETLWIIDLLKSFINPFNIVLIILAIVSTFTDVIIPKAENRSFTAVIVILTMVTVSALLQFFQEKKSKDATNKLTAMVTKPVSAFP